MKLSILIPTLVEREKLLAALVAELERQIDAAGAQGDVEILTFPDNREKTVGEKRNALIDRAQGDFVAFVDDDDEVADDYVGEIYQAILQNPDIDCIGFRGIFTRGGKHHQRQVLYSIHYPGPFESGGIYYRPPCHLTPVRRSVAARYRYGNVNLGEDANWSTHVAGEKALKNEYFVDKVLYHYRFNAQASWTQKNYKVPVPNPSPADLWKVVILSARAENLKSCLDALFENEPALSKDRVIVVDDGATKGWDGSHPGILWITGKKPFVYARNANMGITGAARDVILLNDDARLATKFGFSSLAFAVHERGGIAVASALVDGVAGGSGQAPEDRLAGIRYVPNVAFVATYIPAAAVVRLGLLDEQFVGYGFEDNDYCLRASKASLGVAVYDGCRVLHDRPETSTFRTKPDWSFLMAQNRAVFEKKWGKDILEPPKPAAAAAAPADASATDPNVQKGMEFFQKEEWEQAIPYLVAASKTAVSLEDRSEFMLRVGRCHSNLSRPDVAANWYQGAAQEAPDRREVPFFHGISLVKLRRLDEAIPIFEKCLEIPASKRPFSIYDNGNVWDDKFVREALDFCRKEIEDAKKRAARSSHVG